MDELEASYAECKRLNSLHGKTYYLATLLLPKAKRKYVHALYGFARYADEIVDDLASTLTVQEKADALGVWGKKILQDLKSGQSNDAIGRQLGVCRVEHQVINGLLVVQNHLGFQRVLAFGGLAKLDQPLCIQPAVGVALQL